MQRKSTIFNRMIGERLSIVEDTPGVTRDRIYGKCTWLTKEFRCIDTGGIQMDDQPFQNEIQMQVEIVMSWKDKFGKMQRFTLDHRCRECDAHLVKLTGSSKQLNSLLCPKCSGEIKIEESSIIHVVSNAPKPKPLNKK